MPTYVANCKPSRLWNWLSSVPPFSKQLAWCHTTDAFRLRDIIEGGELDTTHCKIFCEDLLYFFYGRPAFRRNETTQLRTGASAPVVVVFSPDLSKRGKRIFPFDSGAFEDRYVKWLHRGMQLADFELACPGDAPQRSVAAFFSTNSNYLNMKPVRPLSSFTGEFEVEAVFKLLSDENSDDADDRRLAIELQVNGKVPFDSSSVLAIVVPDELLQAPWLGAFRNGPGANIQIETYKQVTLWPAGHYQALLESMAERIQIDRGYV